MHVSYPNRGLAKIMATLLILGLLTAACAQATATPEEAAAPPPAGEMDALIAAAQAEGTVTTIALPHDWCNYEAVFTGFKAKYGLEGNELDPGAGSAEELEAVRANQGNPGPQAPDVVDVGLSFGPTADRKSVV